MVQNDPSFFWYVLFSDESKFYSDGQLNRHNCHYWSDENPHWYRPMDHQNRWSVMVWCERVNGYLNGPYFYDGNIDGYTYLALLRERWLSNKTKNVASTRWCSAIFCTHRTWVFELKFQWEMDWTRRSIRMAPLNTRSNITWFLFMGLY